MASADNSGVNPEEEDLDGKIRQALLEIEDAEGRLDPEIVIERARDQASPLNGYFEWDDDVAAHQYRITQARRLIRSIKVEVVVRDVPMNVVSYIRDQGGYQNIVRVRSDAEKARAAIIDEMTRVAQAVKRARAVAAFLGAAEDVEEIGRIAANVITQANNQPGGTA